LPKLDLPPDKLLFNQGEVAEIAGISRHQVKVSIRNGDLPTRRVGGMLYVTRASLRRYLEWLYGDEATEAGAGRGPDDASRDDASRDDASRDSAAPVLAAPTLRQAARRAGPEPGR
jgi:hypothetical protein